MNDLIDLNELSLSGVYRELTRNGASTRAIFALEREADLGDGGALTNDVTTDALSIGAQPVRATVCAREPMTIAGLAAIDDLMASYAISEQFIIDTAVQDGARVQAGETLAQVSGISAEILAIERPMLNMLSRLSGIATLATRYVEAACQAAPAV
ncbi:MAG: hypothetical protein AAGB34_06965, partial [Planctomycetota bacterium]